MLNYAFEFQSSWQLIPTLGCHLNQAFTSHFIAPVIYSHCRGIFLLHISFSKDNMLCESTLHKPREKSKCLKPSPSYVSLQESARFCISRDSKGVMTMLCTPTQARALHSQLSGPKGSLHEAESARGQPSCKKGNHSLPGLKWGHQSWNINL